MRSSAARRSASDGLAPAGRLPPGAVMGAGASCGDSPGQHLDEPFAVGWTVDGRKIERAKRAWRGVLALTHATQHELKPFALAEFLAIGVVIVHDGAQGIEQVLDALLLLKTGWHPTLVVRDDLEEHVDAVHPRQV